MSPKRFRKKPVVIEAMQVPDVPGAEGGPDLEAWATISGWLLGHACDFKIAGPDDSTEIVGIDIRTLEGVMRADIGDWIIKGTEGEFYPCKPAAFAATFDDADRRSPMSEVAHMLNRYMQAAYVHALRGDLEQCAQIIAVPLEHSGNAPHGTADPAWFLADAWDIGKVPMPPENATINERVDPA